MRRKRKPKPKIIVEEAKKIVKDVNSRYELIKRLSKKFKLSESTIDRYLCLEGFRTGFRYRGSGKHLKKYWEDVKKGKAKKLNKTYERSLGYEVIRLVSEKPLFTDEIAKHLKVNKKLISSILNVIKKHGIIKTFKIKGRVLVFMNHNRAEAAFRIKKNYPKYFTFHKRDIISALNLRYVVTNNGVKKIIGVEK